MVKVKVRVRLWRSEFYVGYVFMLVCLILILTGKRIKNIFHHSVANFSYRLLRRSYTCVHCVVDLT